jgi:hypothetical protein
MYYTPALDEFHVGFIYEEHTRSLKERINEAAIPVYAERRIETAEQLTHALSLLTNDFIPKLRVKCLDKEDLESLGYMRYSKTAVDWYDANVYINAPIYRGHKINYVFIQHSVKEHWIKLIVRFSSDNTDVLFEGIIKNKSEFIRLLNQLSLIEETSPHFKSLV